MEKIVKIEAGNLCPKCGNGNITAFHFDGNCIFRCTNNKCGFGAKKGRFKTTLKDALLIGIATELSRQVKLLEKIERHMRPENKT